MKTPDRSITESDCELRVYEPDGSLWAAVPFRMVGCTNPEVVVTQASTRTVHVGRVAIYVAEFDLEFPLPGAPTIHPCGQLTLERASLGVSTE